MSFPARLLQTRSSRFQHFNRLFFSCCPADLRERGLFGSMLQRSTDTAVYYTREATVVLPLFICTGLCRLSSWVTYTPLHKHVISTTPLDRSALRIPSLPSHQPHAFNIDEHSAHCRGTCTCVIVCIFICQQLADGHDRQSAICVPHKGGACIVARLLCCSGCTASRKLMPCSYSRQYPG